MSTSILEESLAQDMAEDPSVTQPEPEVPAEDTVTAPEQEEVVAEPEAPAEEEVDDDLALPENPTPEDFRKQRLAMKRIKQEAKEAAIEKARLEGYVKAKNEQPVAQAHAKQDEPVDVEPEKGTLEWFEWRDKQWEKKLQQVEQSAQLRENKARISELVSEAKTQEAEYIKSSPEYPAAKTFLDSRARQIVAQNNPTATPDQIDAFVKQEEYSAIMVAKQLGFAPPLYFEMLARQAGFKAAPSLKTPPKQDLKPNFDAIRKNQAKSGSLINQPAVGKMEEPTDEEIADMTVGQMMKMGYR